MLDYEQVKKHFADKLAADFAGHGRFESAFYHTVRFVYEAGLRAGGFEAGDMADAAAKGFRDGQRDDAELRAFLESLLDPEQYGFAVSTEVRMEASRLLARRHEDCHA